MKRIGFAVVVVAVVLYVIGIMGTAVACPAPPCNDSVAPIGEAAE